MYWRLKILFIILTEDYCFHPKDFCKWETGPLSSTGWIDFKYIHVSLSKCSSNTWSIAQDCWSHTAGCGDPADKRGLVENTRCMTSADLLQVFFFPSKPEPEDSFHIQQASTGTTKASLYRRKHPRAQSKVTSFPVTLIKCLFQGLITRTIYTYI